MKTKKEMIDFILMTNWVVDSRSGLNRKSKSKIETLYLHSKRLYDATGIRK